MNYTAKNLIIATLYYLSGRLGLFMAEDPSIATLFWPGAGVALAAVYICGYRLLPGVFLGAAVLNIFNVYAQGPEFQSETAVLRAILMGIPPAVQAFAGAYLVRRFLGDSCRLETLREVIIFSLFAGPASCLISPSLSVSVLYSYGLLSAPALPLSWSTWYVGDMLGVLVFAPVCVIFMNEHISLRRKVLVTLPLFSIFMLVISAFFYAVENENHVRRTELASDAGLMTLILRNDLNESFSHMDSVRSFFKASDFVTQEEFTLFLQRLFKEKPTVLGVYWAQRVERESLKLFEEKQTEERGSDFKILEKGDDGQFVPVTNRADYYPVLYAVQRQGMKITEGLDIGMFYRTSRLFDMSVSREGDFWMFDPSELSVGSNRNFFGLFFPIYEQLDAQVSKGTPAGFITGVVDLDGIIERIGKAWAGKGVDLEVLRGEQADAAYSLMRHEGSIFMHESRGLVYQVPFEVGEERWVLSFCLKRSFMEGRVNWGMWYILAGSFLFTFLASGFLLVVTGHGSVTEAVVKEKTLQLSDQTNFLKVIMDNVPDMLFVKNEQHEIVAANKAFLNLYSPEDQAQLIGRTGLEIFTEEERAIYKQQDDAAFSKGYTEVVESNTDHLGVQRSYFTRKIRFKDTSGRYLLLGLSRDVSEILTVQEHLDSILMATADGLLVIEDDGSVSTFNKACEQIFGYSSEEVIGKNVSLLEPENQREDYQGNFQYYITLPGLSGERKRQELWGRHKNGAIFPIYLAASQVKIGARRFYCAIVRDISVEKKAQEDLRRSNQELEDFAYVASHDLKAPLRHLSLSANFLLKHYTEDLDVRGRELLDIIQNSSGRMFEMIDSLLAYSSVGREGVEMSRVHLGEVVQDVLDGMRSSIEGSSARIECGVLPQIHGNRALLTQLFQNLIQNAIKYKRDDRDPVLHISAVRENWFWVISVADNGIGIDPQYKEKIFKLFQRLHGESQYPGTGIGLALCQRIVEFHGGTIALDENYSDGSCFIVKLPAG
ncbi:MAG: PAS domain S-box protein [Alphaproteobacteria bacterium]|nr:PAS domain S-box protein [Alphaproteobacteria bacterium]